MMQRQFIHAPITSLMSLFMATAGILGRLEVEKV
jgi:hypothetical protein